MSTISSLNSTMLSYLGSDYTTELMGTLTSSSSDSSGASSLITDMYDTIQVSQTGALYSALSSVAESDTETFTTVCSSIAEKLADAASNATGDTAVALTNMAGRFTEAAESGDMSALTTDTSSAGYTSQSAKAYTTLASSASKLTNMMLFGTDSNTSASITEMEENFINGIVDSASS